MDRSTSPAQRVDAGNGGANGPTRIGVLTAAAILAIMFVLAAGWHMRADALYRASLDRSASLSARTDAAQSAARLEPWNAEYAVRATVMQKWLHGSILLSQGADLPAMLELAQAYKLDVGDEELLALFQKSQAELTLHSNFKAHVQHGHEGSGGTLRPQDLLP
jgi:hypothetical protein